MCAKRVGHFFSYAAASQQAVSKALLINGMLVPKAGLLPFLEALGAAPGLPALISLFWATSLARSHDPISWERATEKNKNT